MSGAEAELSRDALKRFFPGRPLHRYLRPLPEHGVFYVKNPKAACSTLMVWLDRIHTGDHGRDPARIHSDHGLPSIQDLGWATVSDMLTGSAYRFSFVRDPLRRLESAYWDKIVHNENWGPTKVREKLQLNAEPDATLSFEEFLDAVERQDPVREMDPHWRPQHLNLMHPVITYDRIGRLESFDADLELVRQEAGLPRVPLQVRNTSAHRYATSVYDGRPDLVSRVEALFATDLELYGY
ncbi:MAG: sulfotransferase family protein [Nocardioides sp.]